MFYQSIGSSTCAIVAAANLLHLYDLPYSRNEAHRLFGFTSFDRKLFVSHPKLLNVLATPLCCGSLYWKRYATFSFDPVSQGLKKLLRCGAPALLTFHMRHRKRNWFGVHCVIVVAADDLGIHVIDSLGRRDGRAPNATITPNESRRGWRVSGAPLIVTRGPALVLNGLPQLRKYLGERK
jgi:hypothetical protein